MKLRINQAWQQIDLVIPTLQGLLIQLNLTDGGFAIAVNQAVIRHDDFAQTTLTEGDNIDIVTALAGG